MNQIKLLYKDGIYSAPIDITVDEWKEMLRNPEIFDESSMSMIISWYKQPFHQATSKEVMIANGITGGTPYNGIVKGLGIRIVKHLNRFTVQQNAGTGNSYFIIPFEGWHVNYTSGEPFVWKLRDELIFAMEELGIVNTENGGSEIESLTHEKNIEGKRVQYFSTRYERSAKNRNAAIRIHGTVCMICGFDFEKVYGVFGKGYIEVHHVRPLSKDKEEIEVNPEKDLICICANCHRMLHRTKHDTLSPKRLKKIIAENK